VFIEVITLLSERFGWNHHVWNGSFKIFVVVNVVEELVAEHFNLVFVHIWEHLEDRPGQKLNHSIFVARQSMGLRVVHLYWLLDQVLLHKLDQLLENKALQLKSGEVAAVWHHPQSFFDNERVEAHVENGPYGVNTADFVVEVEHAFQPDIHDLWLLVFHSENHCVDDGFKHLSLQLKHALGAMIDNVFHQDEERLSELWIRSEILWDHVKSRLAEADQNLRQEWREVLPLFLENSREQHHSLRITSIWIRFLIVLDHRLQRWQKVLVEKLEIHLPLNIDLD